MNKYGKDCDYLDWAYGGLHVPHPINKGSFVDVYTELNFQPNDLKHEYISPTSCIERARVRRQI